MFPLAVMCEPFNIKGISPPLFLNTKFFEVNSLKISQLPWEFFNISFEFVLPKPSTRSSGVVPAGCWIWNTVSGLANPIPLWLAISNPLPLISPLAVMFPTKDIKPSCCILNLSVPAKLLLCVCKTKAGLPSVVYLLAPIEIP